ncbi:MAG: 30S ribosomal protein S1 [Smithellaceae bacterium]|nr:30S ribosomal protein S1 [Smithellaceae bacterium]
MVNNDNVGHDLLEQGGDKEIDTDIQTHGADQDFSFKDLYEQSLQNIQFGEIVSGRVVQITNDLVMVDVGWKTEGHIPIRELKDAEGNITVALGDEIVVLVDKRDSDGTLILSKEKAAKIKVWDDVKAACENVTPMTGTILERVKGGLSVDIGVIGFLPGSQVDIRPVRDLDKLIGQTMPFNVIKYDRKRNNVVLSRRAIIEKEREREKSTTLLEITEGKVVEGVIKNITDYGVFVDLGGIDGLLHVTDISWGRITRPADHFAKGDRIQVKVLSFDRERERVSIGIKQLYQNPWDGIQERYPLGSMVSGKVVNIKDYGVFVEIEPGLEGLVHVSEMFWTREIKHPSKIVAVGDTIPVMVLDINLENKRISLGLKQTKPNPWEEVKKKYQEGSIIRGIVKNITNFGAFVGVEEGIDGLIHISDMSWQQRINHPSELFKKGQEVEAVVLSIDAEHEKFSLGIKQIGKNPWEELSERYTPGSVISGRITNITDFGIFVELQENIEGLVHVSEISHKKAKDSAEGYRVGETINAIIKSIDSKNRKIRLSIKDQDTASEGGSVNQYINNRENVGSNLGKALADVRFQGVDRRDD